MLLIDNLIFNSSNERSEYLSEAKSIDEVIIFISVRRQNIWLRLGLRLAEFRPHHGVDIKRRSCGAASVDVG